MWKDTDFSEDDKAILAKIMTLGPRDRSTTEHLLVDDWVQNNPHIGGSA